MTEYKFYVFASFYNGKRGWYRIRGIDQHGNYIGNFPDGVDKVPGMKFCQDKPKGRPVSERLVREYFGYVVKETADAS